MIETPAYRFMRTYYDSDIVWFRELIYVDDDLVGEITESRYQQGYELRKFTPIHLEDGDVIEVTVVIGTFDTVANCKDFINNGGLK